MTQPQSLLASFDPFAAHPFTNTNGVMPSPPMPSKYPRPIPHAHSTFAHAPTHPSSLPTSQSMTSPAAPHPHHASPSPSSPTSSGHHPTTSSKGIFVMYTPDRRATPDLEDILSKKKRAQTWSTK
ncbi:hypothetical protein OF83DRAFT_1171183 [Amylostereum chailletii]|nr:hypothetical protein OF83DRAFT_1171183 [Amylostereum chailletii]